jgi:imidazoleglycerol phosphate dehydratase HisB|tara:strand:- start:88 stop:270 length:183 start_codon:yes stop_codon:yes gene_type:complete
MQDEYLTRCVVDTSARKFYLYSNDGDEKVIDCDNVEQFMGVLEYVRENTPEDILAYANPL